MLALICQSVQHLTREEQTQKKAEKEEVKKIRWEALPPYEMGGWVSCLYQYPEDCTRSWRSPDGGLSCLIAEKLSKGL